MIKHSIKLGEQRLKMLIVTNGRKLLRGSRLAATVLSVSIWLVGRAIAIRIIILGSAVIRVVHGYAEYFERG